jgi:hypothetical protein
MPMPEAPSRRRGGGIGVRSALARRVGSEAGVASVSGRSDPAELRRAPPKQRRGTGNCKGSLMPGKAATEHCLRPGRSLPDADA